MRVVRRRFLAALWPLLAVAALYAPGRASADDDALAQCESRDPDIAIKACSILIERGGVDIEVLPKVIAQRAGAYASKFDYDHAVKDYTHAIKLRPEFWIAYDGRGLAHANRLSFELAIKDYDQAIKLKPDAAKAYYHRGLAKFGLCDIDGADADIMKAREIDPDVGDNAS
jgi:tetratricopeptide (TPR) repeat protein